MACHLFLQKYLLRQNDTTTAINISTIIHDTYNYVNYCLCPFEYIFSIFILFINLQQIITRNYAPYQIYSFMLFQDIYHHVLQTKCCLFDWIQPPNRILINFKFQSCCVFVLVGSNTRKVKQSENRLFILTVEFFIELLEFIL